MTPEQRAFEAALKDRLQERGRILLTADQAVVKAIKTARQSIVEQLAAQPAEWQQWQLSRLVAQLDAVLAGAASTAGTAADVGLRQAWQQGEDGVDKPLGAAGINVELRLPMLDARVLQAMRTFTASRLKNVAAEAISRIEQQLGLVTIGAVTPHKAIQAIQHQLEGPTPQRATTIVRTEVGRAYAVAGQQRIEQAAGLVPGLQKQWRRSGKIHSRWSHDLMDGHVVDADKPFKVPNPGGGIDLMMCPHDPRAPIEQVINCGCLSIPHVKGWQVITPKAKPFSERELQLDGRKAYLDQAAKRVSRRLDA